MSELLHSPDAELAALKARVARLERLEEQVYFQERTLSALNEAITLQQRQLDDLQGRMEAVEEKFRELWELVGNEGGEATVPPHYKRLGGGRRASLKKGPPSPLQTSPFPPQRLSSLSNPRCRGLPKKKSLPCSWEGFLLSVKADMRDSIRSKVLGREGVWGRETFLQKGFPPPHFFFFFPIVSPEPWRSR